MRRRLPLVALAAATGVAAAAVTACGVAAPQPVTPVALLAAEKMNLPASGGMVQPDNATPDGRALKIWANATATGYVTTPAVVRIDVRARGEVCVKPPRIQLSVDGFPVGQLDIVAGAYRTYSLSTLLGAGKHRVQVALINDYAAGGHCDRNVWLDWVQFDRAGAAPAPAKPTSSPAPTKPSPTPTKPSPSPTKPSPTPATPSASPSSSVSPSPTPSPSVTTSPSPSASPSTTPTTPPPTTPAPVGTSGANPFAGAALFVDPWSSSANEAKRLSSTDPKNAALLQKIADQPQADWYGDWNSTTSVQAQVSARVTQVTAAGDLPVLVTYAIPNRDCSGYSAGGLANADAYREWMTQFADGIGDRKAVVIVEPDALAGMTCLSEADQSTRLAELRDAVDVLSASPQTAIYLDAGHSGWQSIDTMTKRLQAVGTGKIRGFSLNVSGFGLTSSEITYGEQLATATGTHYLVDTSRNGLGPGVGTCNPPGRALGQRPTTLATGAQADAFLWVKHPGESDGDCDRGDPAAGVWSNALAEDLASRASY